MSITAGGYNIMVQNLFGGCVNLIISHYTPKDDTPFEFTSNMPEYNYHFFFNTKQDVINFCARFYYIFSKYECIFTGGIRQDGRMEIVNITDDIAKTANDIKKPYYTLLFRNMYHLEYLSDNNLRISICFPAYKEKRFKSKLHAYMFMLTHYFKLKNIFAQHYPPEKMWFIDEHGYFSHVTKLIARLFCKKPSI